MLGRVFTMQMLLVAEALPIQNPEVAGVMATATDEAAISPCLIALCILPAEMISKPKLQVKGLTVDSVQDKS